MWNLLNFYPSISKNCGDCKIQFVSYEFDIFKTNDSIFVKLLIIQKNVKSLLTHSNVIVKDWIAYVSIYFNKCNMQLVSNGFNIFKLNGLIHVHMLIIEMMWKNQ
jgi:hypothetical protein